ncbi:hypothetical protein V8D89_003135 [Ganoderma adspersum]
MHPKALVYLVFLLSTLVSCTVFVDDQDGSPSVHWDGSWERYSDLGSAYTELAWQGTLTLGNQSGATVTFTFTGTSVWVFGSLWPGETETSRSMYVVDNGRPTEFVPSGLEEPSRLQFYGSGTLPAGEHTLKVTNLGAFLWLDYFEFDDADPTGDYRTAVLYDDHCTVLPRNNDHGIPISFQYKRERWGVHNFHNFRVRHIFSVAPPPLYPIPSSPSSTSSSSDASGTSSNASPPPPQDAATPQTHAHRMSHGALVGLITATTAGGVALLALVLFYFVRRHFRRTRSRLRDVDAALPSFQKPAPPEEGDPHPHASGDASLVRSATRSPTTTGTGPPGVRGVRPASEAGDIDRSACDCGPAAVGPRATDGGVSVAGGRGFSHGGDAPSISEVEDEKNMLPPPYQDCADP